ncbi:MAG: hypothetical protein WBW99_02035, partial [Pseudolabrys sp.]
ESLFANPFKSLLQQNRHYADNQTAQRLSTIGPSVERDTGSDGRGFVLSAPKIFEPPWCQFGVAALGEAALQQKVTRLKEKSGLSSNFLQAYLRSGSLYRANFPPTQAAELLCRLRFFQVFPLCKDRHSQLRRRWKQEKEKPDGCCY